VTGSFPVPISELVLVQTVLRGDQLTVKDVKVYVNVNPVTTTGGYFKKLATVPM